MGIGDSIQDALGSVGANIDLFGGNAGQYIMGFILFLFAFAIIGIIIYYFADKKKYCHKIQIFEEVNGQAVPTKQYRAKEVTIPNTSIRVFYLKEGKMFLPRPTIQTGKNNWLFFIRDDHEWVNIGISSLNKQLTEMGLKYNHVDMRYANASLKELIKTNYGEKNFWKEYGAYVALGFLVIAICVGFYLVAEQQAEVANQLATAIKTNSDLMKTLVEKAETSGITKLN